MLPEFQPSHRCGGAHGFGTVSLRITIRLTPNWVNLLGQNLKDSCLPGAINLRLVNVRSRIVAYGRTDMLQMLAINLRLVGVELSRLPAIPSPIGPVDRTDLELSPQHLYVNTRFRSNLLGQNLTRFLPLGCLRYQSKIGGCEAGL
jgi:hypothetical protein